MEGLIPMVYKAIKKNKARRQYECLSSGAAQSYQISDFYGIGFEGDQLVYSTTTTTTTTTNVYSMRKPPSPSGAADHHEAPFDSVPDRKAHRRYRSMEDFSSSVSGPGSASSPMTTKKKQLARFGSHRLFMCVTGA